MKLIYALSTMLLLAGCGRDQPKNAEDEQRRAPQAAARPAPTRAEADHRPVIVAFGDSLSAGFGVDPGYSYPDYLQKDIDRRGYHYRVVNAGISGDTTTDGLERIQTVMVLKPVIVILEFGGNDGLRGVPVESSRANLEQMVMVLQKAGVRIVLAGMTLPPNYGPEYIRAFQMIYEDLAKKYKLPLIPFLLEGVGGHAGLMQRDGIHPNAEGSRIVAGNVMRVLEPLLLKK